MQTNADYTYKSSVKARDLHKYAQKTHKNGGYVSAFKPCGSGSENSEKIGWF